MCILQEEGSLQGWMQKDEDGSEKKFAKALRAKVARAESNDDDEHIHLFMAQMLQE